ncbi:MAG: 5-formyltetrahydrofolate cyclo-ligase [Lachnospiraceae bacterium]
MPKKEIDPMTDKRNIRKQILHERDMLPKEQRILEEEYVTQKVLTHQWYLNATDFLVFKSYGSEISTEYMISRAFKDGKRVYLPRVLADGEHMEFFRMESPSDVENGYRGILEPKGKEMFQYEACKKEKVLMIMPGVAFDQDGNRIGYGKGFYDRYLSKKEGLRTIAVAFRCQIVEKIEKDPHDISPMQVLFR